MMANKEIVAYKIVEKHCNDFKTLFHGINGSKKIPFNEWIEADEKMVKDGTSNTSYLSGWHVLLNEHDANEYIKSFSRRLDKLEIIKVMVKEIREKTHSRSPVFLAKHLMIKS